MCSAFWRRLPFSSGTYQASDWLADCSGKWVDRSGSCWCFFVLSGFVIAYVADTREQTAKQYFISRAARIYSVAIPALIITFLLDAVGRSVNPPLYNPSWHYVWDGRWLQFLQAITFTNQLWFNNLPPGSDFPYWSLGYEVWYYIIFGAVLFLSKRWRYLV